MINNFIDKLVLLAIIIFIPIVVDATPNINSVLGTVSNGGNVVIRGNGFGNKAVAEPIKYDFFEQSNSESGIGKTIANGWGTPDRDNYYDPVYNNANNRTGSTKHIRCEWTSETPGAGEPVTDSHCPFYYDHNAPLTEIYATFWVRIKISGFISNSMGGPNVKWFRVVNETDPFYASIDPTVYSSFTSVTDPASKYYGIISNKTGIRGTLAAISGVTTYHSLPMANGWDGYMPTPVGNVWIRCEYIMKESSAPGGTFDGTSDGYVVINYQMGGEGNVFKKVFEKTNIITNQEGQTTHWEAIRFAEYNKNEYVDMIIDWDDIYIDNTQARVEIGDNAVWEKCTHREIQIPTKWQEGDGSRFHPPGSGLIEITVNQGSFTSGSAYLYVVNSDGKISDGHPINFN